MIDEAFINAILKLGDLIYRFSRVNRGVPFDRNGTKESDTDHTVLLSLVACCIASKYKPELDIGKVAQYALVHDLVEAYCNDTNTMEYSKVDLNAKKSIEKEALNKLKNDHQYFPWMGSTIDNYEELKDPESRFIKAIDKAMPAIIHNLNDGFMFEKEQAKGDFQKPSEFQEDIRGRDKWLRKNEWARGQDFALNIREELMEKVITQYWKKFGL